jgi:pimeloyl-ACP methyl ester carboxylesterase/DNA-binding CsgD family transcriptional regulator
MTETQRAPTAQFADREQKAEIVDRLYDVALDPIRLEDLLDVWESRAAPLRVGTVDQAIQIDDPEIAAHLGRASVFLDRYEPTRADGGYRSILAEIPRLAAFIGDGGATIAACNRPAAIAFGIRDGSPAAELPFDEADVDMLRGVMAKVAGGRAERVVTLRLRSVVSGSPVIMRVSPVESDSPRPLALVLSTELIWPEGFAETVAEAFALTPAEVEIVEAITVGQPIRDIAEARGRSVETVRTQLRSILQKTETHSQSELVRVVLGLMDVSTIGTDPSAAARPATGLSPVPFRTIRGSNGRRLDYISFGDPQGAPVLYMHLDYGMIRWPAPAERAATARRMRVIVPVRAGYGATDLHPRGTGHLEGVAEDYARVLDHLGLKSAVVIALGADLRFALQLAETRPDLVTAIIGCAAQLPLRTAAQYDRMDKWQRFILANARYAPKVLPFLVKAGFSLARRLGKAAFFTQVNGGSPADMETFAIPEVREAILSGTDVCLGPVHLAAEAFTRECIGSERDWSGLVRRAQVPVELIQGDQDPQTPVLTVQELLADFPRLKVTFVRAGQLAFFAHWPMVLDRVAALQRAAK